MKSEMKGRNGYSRLGRISLSMVGGRVHVDCYSPRPGKSPTAALMLDPADARLLYRQLKHILASGCASTIKMGESDSATPEEDGAVWKPLSEVRL